jgi:dTDP-4-amino-4,6-dideoxygalactose transaminase
LGACGEAGAATTNDAAIAKTMKMLRDHGQATKYYHDVEGYNGRLDAIQAGLLHVKLAHLAKWNAQRRERAAEYKQLLKSADGAVVPPCETAWSHAVYHLYVVRTADREGLMDHLKKVGIGTGIHYPIPLHLQKAYAAMNYRKGDFPITEKAAAEIVSLPMFPQLTAAQQARVAEEILNFTSMSARKHVETEAVSLAAATRRA